MRCVREKAVMEYNDRSQFNTFENYWIVPINCIINSPKSPSVILDTLIVNMKPRSQRFFCQKQTVLMIACTICRYLFYGGITMPSKNHPWILRSDNKGLSPYCRCVWNYGMIKWLALMFFVLRISPLRVCSEKKSKSCDALIIVKSDIANLFWIFTDNANKSLSYRWIEQATEYPASSTFRRAAPSLSGERSKVTFV